MEYTSVAISPEVKSKLETLRGVNGRTIKAQLALLIENAYNEYLAQLPETQPAPAGAEEAPHE